MEMLKHNFTQEKNKTLDVHSLFFSVENTICSSYLSRSSFLLFLKIIKNQACYLSETILINICISAKVDL